MTLRITCIEKSLKTSQTVEVPVTATVHDVRVELSKLIKRKLPGILLFDGDEYLQNHVPLAEYGIADGASLNYEARLCGVLPADHDWSKSGLKTKQTRFAF